MIRRATEQDVEPIALLYQRIFATMTYLPVIHTHEEHVGWLRARVADHEGWVWDDGDVRGYMLLGDDELLHLYLDVGFTGQGIGTKMLDHAKERRPDGFTLWTFQQNDGARRFYERHGLTTIEFGDGSGNEEGVPDVKYAWRPGDRSEPSGQ